MSDTSGIIMRWKQYLCNRFRNLRSKQAKTQDGLLIFSDP